MAVGDGVWLETELRRLLSFGTSATAGVWLDDTGRGDFSRPRATWIAARMLHVRSLGALLDVPGSFELAAAALATLDASDGGLRDQQHGGWFPQTDSDGGKTCYDHAFVLLAADTASRAGVPGADALRRDASEVLEQRFWDEGAGRTIDSWDRAWTRPSSYRGLNATMHAVEAMLAVGGDWQGRASKVASWVADLGRTHSWRLPEHFDQDWQPQLEQHHDRPDDPFQPYGATIGHALEWSRLLLAVDPEQFLPAAVELYGRAVIDGWHADGAPGFVYTTDWSGRPVVRDRMHWVVAEAIAAAAVLAHHTGEPRYDEDYQTFWTFADECLLDRERGSWNHQLDPDNQPTATVWAGKPDLYHAVQATLIPLSPGATCVAAGLTPWRRP